MSFPLSVRLDALVACQRFCCLCHQPKHTRMQCHHIVQEADGGANTLDNCIPLCSGCHAEVKAYDPHHPYGVTSYSTEELKRRRNDWYEAIRRRTNDLATNLQRSSALYPHNPALRGEAKFNYSNHYGFFRLGEGNSEFLTHWSNGGATSVHCYQDSTNVSIALTPNGTKLQDITEASLLNFSSRVRTPHIGQFIVLGNHCGRYAALQIRRVQYDPNDDTRNLLAFDYWILEDGNDDFSKI